jgi:CTP synthase
LDPELHPFFVATQAHPELKSRPTRAHPLFAGFVGAALCYADADRLPVELTEPAQPGAATQPGASQSGAQGQPGAQGQRVAETAGNGGNLR